MQGVWGKENPLKEAQELVKCSSGGAREASKKEELDRSRKKIRVVAKKGKLGAKVAVNMHALGTSFANNVKDARWTTGKWSEEERPEDMVEF